MTTQQKAHTRKEAAELVGLHPNQLSKAINATEGHRLKAKRVGGRIRILDRDLWEWFDGLPDA